MYLFIYVVIHNKNFKKNLIIGDNYKNRIYFFKNFVLK